MISLAEKVALVTGASRGVGAATARMLAEQGVTVTLASRRGDDLGIAGALGCVCDVRDPQQVEALVAEIVKRFGSLDIVAVNAGVGAYGAFLDLDPDWLEEMVDANIKGMLYTVRATLPQLLRSREADLVVVASVAGQRGPEGEAVYAATKFAQVGFMRALDHELWSRGVRCSTICPGGIATEFAMGRGRTPDDPDLAGFMSADEVAAEILHAITRPRTRRILETTLLPMGEDSLG